MRANIDVDINEGKLDYDAINAAILSKLDALTPQEIFDKYSYTDSVIEAHITDLLQTYSKDYLVSLNWMSSPDAKTEIKNMAKKLLEDMVRPEVEKVVNTLSEEERNELFFELYPSVMCDVLYSHMQSTLYGAKTQERQSIQQQVMSMIDSRIRKI